MDGVALAGGVGFGLVWGWLTAGLGSGLRGPWPFRLGLATVWLLAGLLVAVLAGPGEAIVAAAAAGLAMLLRLAWHQWLAARSGQLD